VSPRLSQTLATSLISVAIALFGATASLFGVWLGNHTPLRFSRKVSDMKIKWLRRILEERPTRISLPPYPNTAGS
jgi:hypothetical protein